MRRYSTFVLLTLSANDTLMFMRRRAFRGERMTASPLIIRALLIIVATCYGSTKHPIATTNTQSTHFRFSTTSPAYTVLPGTIAITYAPGIDAAGNEVAETDKPFWRK